MAYDPSATTAYAGIRYAPRPNARRTCADGTPGQQSYISDMVRDIHAARVSQVRAAHTAHPSARWDASTVDALLASLGTVDEAVASQMSAPLTPDTIPALKATLQRERAQLRAQYARMAPAAPVTAPSVAAAAPADLQEDKTYRAPDGRVFRVVRGSSGYLYGKLYVSTGHREGYWEYFPGIRSIPGLVLLTLEEAQAFGQLTGQCSECQTPLEDPVSVVLGIGPWCEQKFTGKARSRSKAFRAEVLARATADQVAQMRPEDRPVATATDAPF